MKPQAVFLLLLLSVFVIIGAVTATRAKTEAARMTILSDSRSFTIIADDGEKVADLEMEDGDEIVVRLKRKAPKK